MIVHALLAQAATAFLLGWWKIPLILAPFIAWGWLISSRLEKDARYFHLNWKMWNGIYLGSGVAALAVMLGIPGTIHIFWISYPLGLIVLLTPILIYWQHRNARVPENKKFYLTAESISAALETRRRARATREAALEFIDGEGKPVKTPLKEEPLYEVHMLAEDLIGPAISARAGRLQLEVLPKGTLVAQTIDGVKYKREPIPVEQALRLIDYLKGIAGLPVEDRRRPGAGDFRVKGRAPENISADIHITTAGSSNAQVMRLDFDRASRLNKPFDAIGFLGAQMEALQTIAEPHERHGIVLVGAPPGHGLSTTMYSLLNRHDAYTSNIKSLERDIQVRLDGVDQVRFDENNPDIDYATNLQSMLRRDPDVIMVSELDAHSARVATDPGADGPLIYVPQRLGSIPEQINAWMKLVGDQKRAVKSLRAVINQRLFRTLCPNCRQPYAPSAEQLKKFNLPQGKVAQLYRAAGKVQVKNKIEPCVVCQGTGYLGQTAAFEVMMIDDEIRRLLVAGDMKGAFDHARRNKMIYLQQAALLKVVAGEVSLEELVRVTARKPATSRGTKKPPETKDSPTAVA